ncbi:MAG: 5-bromo-4-chloroindolyl phosphate hydrolysis family protein [Mogibacterium sp.]|nr:5-bromo-4-chloroindolyl phosphate hydrolysis family protein [Mogibacterium sp.]
MNYIDQMFIDMMKQVDRAVNSNNYNDLNKNLNIQVIDLNKEMQKYNDARRRQQQAILLGQNYAYQKPRPSQPGLYQQQIRQSKGTPFQRVTPRYSNAIFKMFFGIFGFFMFVPLLLSVLMFATSITVGSLVFNLLLAVAGLAACYFLIKSGRAQKSLIDKFNKYSRLCGSEDYISIAKLAKVAGEPEEEVVKALEDMIKAGYLPYAKMDDQKKTLMLSEQVYKEYLDKLNAKMAKEKEEADKKAGIENLNVPESVKKTIREGQDFIDYIKAANARIPDVEMTSKLNKLEFIVNRIFEQVKKDPSTANDLNKLMTYYLPTTKKLVEAYIDLDNQSMSSKNIDETKREISSAMDTINEAFANLFDSMFQDVAWDISSEVSAMKTMMAQDGLADPTYNNMHSSIKQDAAQMISEMDKNAQIEQTVNKIETGTTPAYTPNLSFDDVETEEGTLRQTH